ncbi:hypothetical protein [Thermogemmatispora onikobensis]|uniref:hypothetical protein n=1 Tax=Thermogemmatispora onikobensis TaxID=732234 RepID=UPI000853A16D|nr:hypothetical protein [Thermogemmatispora onikobensis]
MKISLFQGHTQLDALMQILRVMKRFADFKEQGGHLRKAIVARKVPDERKTGTAILSAQQLRWRESVAFDADLTVVFEPRQLYEFNTRL